MAEPAAAKSSTNTSSKPAPASRQSSSSEGQSGFESGLLGLQRTVGNSAVGRLLNSNADQLAAGANFESSVVRLLRAASGTRLGIDGRAGALVSEVLRAPGQRLDQATREFMESGFGINFDQVRIHTDTRAAQSASALNAFAYTAGRDIAFEGGQYAPSTPEGLRLLAHELAHVAQQGGRKFSDGGPLTVGSSSSSFEREADRAADSAMSGRKPAISSLSASVQMLHRAEHGTYVSTLGPQDYLDAGAEFYKTWGYTKNVKRVSTMLDILNDLDRSKKTIESFRIVSHGAKDWMWLGLLPELSPADFGPDQAQFTTEDRFRKFFSGLHIASEAVVKLVLGLLQKDATSAAALATLGVGTDLPAEESPLGILLRAIVDERFLEDAELDTGGKATIANVDELKAFNSLRIKLYGEIVVKALAKGVQKDATKAIATLRAKVTPLMQAAKKKFDPFKQSEADKFADPFIEDAGKGKKRLRKDIKKSVEEGAEGPYLQKLRSVKGKIDASTQIEIRGCNVGKNTATLDAYRNYFGSTGALPSISAPDLYQYFFQLGVATYGTHPTEETRLEGAFNDPATGVAQGFEDLKRTKAGEMTRVTTEKKLTDLASKYAFNADKVRKLNPEIKDPDKLTEGAIVWLVQRKQVAAGIHKTLADFCKDYLGDAKAEAKVAAANPSIQDPKNLKEDDKITIPPDLLTPPVAADPPTDKEFAAAIRKGGASAAFDSTINKPVVHVDDPKRAKAIAEWLERQKFDPKGRTAKELSKLYAGNANAFEAARKKTWIQFLSRSYPTVVDPIFPEDPRYEKHIIRRP